MGNYSVRKVQVALLSVALSFVYAQLSYAQMFSEKEKTAQIARESGYTAREQGNYLKAVTHFEFGCSSGSADSCVQLAMLYGGSKLASSPDLHKAIIYLERALIIDSKETTALQFVAAWRGDSAFDRKDYAEAARHLRVACIRKAEKFMFEVRLAIPKWLRRRSKQSPSDRTLSP